MSDSVDEFLEFIDPEYADALAEVVGRSPLEFPWGYVTYWEPGRIPSGPGSFLWFRTAEEMLVFFVDKEVGRFWLDDADEEERVRRCTKLRKILSVVAEDANKRGAAIAAANKALLRRFRLTWWGTFSDICNSDEPLAGHFREHFRWPPDRSVDGNLTRPISVEDLPAFVEFLDQYGS